MPIEFVKAANIEYTAVEVEYLKWVQETFEELQQQNADLLDVLKAILNSNAKPVHGIGGKEIKGYTLYLPRERYEQALALMEGE